ncbi:hypothetical protein, partial [Leisingera sp. ANG-Vp]|uniref:hypothetical protein n=1 Tax=Leisingera sp. ANG-Vp TaxID=1577896 RepID=UPI0019D36FD2
DLIEWRGDRDSNPGNALTFNGFQVQKKPLNSKDFFVNQGHKRSNKINTELKRCKPPLSLQIPTRLESYEDRLGNTTSVKASHSTKILERFRVSARHSARAPRAEEATKEHNQD